MTYTRWGSNSVGQSSVLIKRRSRVQVSPAPPISDELTDEQLENVIGGASSQRFNLWRVKIINERDKNATDVE
jgi:bacteriocin-like protein